MSQSGVASVSKVSSVITGELKSKIDRVWDAFWSGGISNPLEVIEQITYLLFLRRLDDLHTLEENRANTLDERGAPRLSGRQGPEETPVQRPARVAR